MLPQALDGITPDMAITDVAEALRLPRHADGHFETGKTSGQRLVLLGAGDLFAWQRQKGPTSWTWMSGAALALTVSADGHDAQAFHLGISQKNTTVDALVWHTCETLGYWSLVTIACAASVQPEIEYAAPDWYPRPRRAAGVDS
jgi:predicted cupin superfamily sugar epimerase